MNKTLTWKKHIEQLVVEYCNKKSLRTFTLQEFQMEMAHKIETFRPDNKDPYAKLRQQLQELREDGVLSFIDNRGTYTLRKPIILKGEIAEEA